jgi:uncharacterized Zn-binding protein involved in type VI secretion
MVNALQGTPMFLQGVLKSILLHILCANTVFTNTIPQTIVGSIGTTDCGHTTTAITGSSTVFVEGQPIHRFGDVGVINEGDGDHLVITSSSDVGN